MEYEFSQEKLKSKRFDKAVEVSAQLFIERGIDNVKMTDIAEESDIGVATLYRYFGTKTGMTIAAMRMFLVLYEAHPGFMKLLSEFDLIIIRDRVPKEELKEYDQSVIDFYPVVERAFVTGLADGTVRDDIDFRLFYISYAHALMELGKKLILGELLPSDDFSAGEKEMEMLIEAAVCYLRKE